MLDRHLITGKICAMTERNPVRAIILTPDERVLLLRTHYFEPRMSDQVEIAVLDAFRWWKVTDLAHATERLTPLSLAAIVSSYLRSGPPIEPLSVEILED